MRESKKRINKLIATALMSCVVVSTTYSQALATENHVANGNGKSVLYNNEQEAIKNIRLKCKQDLIGDSKLDVNNKAIATKIRYYERTTEKCMANINLDSNAKWLWPDLKDYKTNPARITSMFNNLVNMSMAYNLPNNKYYKNKKLKETIIYALDWINKNAYNKNIDQYGNWWDWMIGIPARLNNVVVLMYDDLTETQIKNYMDAIQKFLPSIEPGSKFHTGANLADVCMNKLLQGVNEKDPSKIKEASEDIVGLFDYVDSGDGFYKDGSFVQHGIVAYTGSYGSVLLEKLSNVMFLLEKTPWSIKSSNKNNIYKWISESFSPIIYKGYVMDMVRGRSISRYNSNGYLQAAGILEGMIKIAMISDPKKATEIDALVKKWALDAKSVVDFGTRFKSMNVIGYYSKFMNDNNLKPLPETVADYELNCMDKTVHKRKDFAFAISRSSNRITKYEFMNKENLTPWFQGDGMTYLYNNDLTQFSGNFWPTVDPYRMPGTTIDTKIRQPKSILKGVSPASSQQDEVYYELGNNTWSGGTKLGTYGVAGMKISNKKDPLKANKSWFMFDDEIVALGSGITNPDNNDTETIVENRKLKENGLNKFLVNGEEKVKNLNDKGEVKNAKWAYLEGNVKGSNIGYYFPDGEDINLIRDKREGNWFAINGSKPQADKVVKDNYVTMYIDHGKNIKDKKYSYVIIPNKSEAWVKNYSEKPDIEILRNDDVAHCVKNKKLNIEAANFWNDGTNTAGSITSTGKSSIIMKEDGNKVLNIALSDPTFKEKKVSIEINKPGVKLISADKRISNMKLDGNKISFDADTSNLKGVPLNLEVQLGNEPKNENKKVNTKDTKTENNVDNQQGKNNVNSVGNKQNQSNVNNLGNKPKENSVKSKENPINISNEENSNPNNLKNKSMNLSNSKNKPNENMAIKNLPKTGDPSSLVLGYLGTILTTLGAVLFKIRKR